jgi:hypothetical protein
LEENLERIEMFKAMVLVCSLVLGSADEQRCIELHDTEAPNGYITEEKCMDRIHEIAKMLTTIVPYPYQLKYKCERTIRRTEVKPSTLKMLKEATNKKYDTQYINYKNAESHYIEVYTNIKRIIKVEATTEKQAIARALKKEENKNSWKNLGYVFVDSDYNIVKEKDYEAYRQNNQKI